MLGRSLRTRAAAGAALVALVVLVATFFVHPAPSGNVLDPGTGPHVLNADPGVVLTHPADDRIQGLYFTGRITGSGLYSAIGAGTDRAVAPSGYVIAVVGVALHVDVTAYPLNQGLSASMLVGTKRWPLDMASWTGDASFMWATAVPKGAPVLLELNDSGANLDYSVNYAKLVGPLPVASWRAPGTVFVDAAAGQANGTVGIDDPYGTYTDANAKATYTVKTAQLSWYGPRSTTEHPAAGDAYLILQPAVSAGPAQAEISPTWPPDRLDLVVPGRPPMASRYLEQSWLGGGFGLYYWEVPASLAYAQLRFEPASFNDERDGVGISSSTPATLSLDFPEAGSPPPTVSADAAAHPPIPGGSNLVWLARLGLLAVFLTVGTLAVAWERADAVRPLRVLVMVEGEEGPKLVPAEAAEPAVMTPDPVEEAPIEVVDLRAPGGGEIRFPQGDDEDRAPDLSEGGEHAALYLMRRKRAAVGRLGALDERHLRVLLIMALAGGGDVPLDGEGIRALYGTDLREPGVKTIENYASELRSFLPAGAVPRYTQKEGYRVGDAVRVDVVEFERLLARAAGLAGPGRAELLAQALDLVWGPPLAAFGRWEFALRKRSRLEAVIARTAAELAAYRRSDRDLVGADAALRAGLRGYELSIQLWDERVRIAKEGGPVPREAVRDEARATFGELFGLLEESGPARPDEPA